MVVRKVFIYLILIMLTGIIQLNANSINSNSKQKEIQRLEDEFKAETGFKGGISFWEDDLRFRSLGGYFPNMHVTGYQDTIAMKAYGDSILKMLIKYTKVPEDQIKYHSVDGNRVKYFQEINGVSFERLDALNGKFNVYFSFDDSVKVEVISSVFVLPDMKNEMAIDSIRAIEIAKPVEECNNTKERVNTYTNLSVYPPPKAELYYINLGTKTSPLVKLCWKVRYLYYLVEIDAINGEVLRHYSETKY